MKTREMKDLIINCKSELLEHTLQEKPLSIHIKNINKYLDKCLNLLESTIEISNTTVSLRHRSSKIVGDQRNNILFFAYCMSKWDYPFVNSITRNNFNQTEAFEYLSKKLKVKIATLRNYRDTFDSHVDQKRSKREGWKKSLNDEFKDVLSLYNSYSEQDLIVFGKDILTT